MALRISKLFKSSAPTKIDVSPLVLPAEAKKMRTRDRLRNKCKRIGRLFHRLFEHKSSKSTKLLVLATPSPKVFAGPLTLAEPTSQLSLDELEKLTLIYNWIKASLETPATMAKLNKSFTNKLYVDTIRQLIQQRQDAIAAKENAGWTIAVKGRKTRSYATANAKALVLHQKKAKIQARRYGFPSVPCESLANLRTRNTFVMLDN